MLNIDSHSYVDKVLRLNDQTYKLILVKTKENQLELEKKIKQSEIYPIFMDRTVI